jgi:thiosulfate dehydrogenase
VRSAAAAAVGLLVVAAAGCSRAAAPAKGPLISARTTMVTAWEIPKNPLNDTTLGKSTLDDQIRWGYKIFTNTPHEASRLTGGKVSCANCHLNAGQRERALPLVAVAGMFPEYNNRAARLISLGDRIVDCFLRSENATGRFASQSDAEAGEQNHPDADEGLSPASKEVLAVSAYIAWLAKGYAVGANPAWRGQNAIASDKLVPVASLDRAHGETVFMERCTSCHGADGQGVQIGDKKAGPLWGPDSWNDGAGAARVYTLAGIIRYTMPYLDPGSLSDEDAQHVAAFINSKPRPQYPNKHRDYPGGKVPVDAVYYRQ